MRTSNWFSKWLTSEVVIEQRNLVVEQLQILNTLENHESVRAKLNRLDEFSSGRLSTRLRVLVVIPNSTNRAYSETVA